MSQNHQGQNHEERSERHRWLHDSPTASRPSNIRPSNVFETERPGSPGGVETMNAEDSKEAPNSVGRSGASVGSVLAPPNNVEFGNRRSQEPLYSALALEKS